MLKGKRLSILGDSISTYQDVSNNPEFNSMLYYNPCFYREPFPVEKTYWHQLMDKLGLTLCVNNSWSGGNLSGIDDEDSGVNRVNYLSDNNGENPDVIIVFMDINDLGRRIPIEVFSADYERALKIIKSKYTNALVCCVNLPDRDIVMKKQTELFNRAIENAVKQMGDNFFVADLFNSRLNNDFYYMNTVDGLHPSESGMTIIAEVIKNAMKIHIKK
ncbi:MAG: SGNH/GDSL hydrolase family protein [Clostridia bacterium]|nr:SGNH/GDSL hydrolase family protein [Clostridia bacterium]